jgi:hypothetical protein
MAPSIGVGESLDFQERFSPEWGGHLRGQLRLSRPPDDSVFQAVGGGTHVEGIGELRLKNRLFFEDWGTLETHYEATAYLGETREKNRRVRELLAGSPSRRSGGFPVFSREGGAIPDDRRLLDLSQTLGRGSDGIVSHRLDRLVWSLRNDRGAALRLGRQALTWGNGLLFHPLDRFNPFAPTDVVRDYKVGDDMLLARTPVAALGELQIVYVPRRNPGTGNLSWEESALGGRLHFAGAGVEFDLLGGWNHENRVIGGGASGYLGGAAWRADLAYTWLPPESDAGGHLSAVVNLDHSWRMAGRNAYGFLEFFHNGLGEDDAPAAVADPDLSEALARGEVFTLGRNYLAGQVRLELHPLVNLFLTAIQNLGDPSGVVQPRLVWSVAQEVELLAGANLYWGGADTEYGGFSVPGIPGEIAPASGLYGWLTWYF